MLLYCMLMSSTATTSQQLPLPPFTLCIITTTPVCTRIHTCAAWPWRPSALLPAHSYCGKKFLPSKLPVHLRFFCGPHAAKSAALAKAHKKRKRSGGNTNVEAAEEDEAEDEAEEEEEEEEQQQRQQQRSSRGERKEKQEEEVRTTTAAAGPGAVE